MTGTDNELLDERYELVTGRIRDIRREDAFGEPLLSFFSSCAKWIDTLSSILDRALSGGIADVSTKELAAENHMLYEDILPDNYGRSFANPDHITKLFTDAHVPEAGSHAKYLSFIYTELRGLIGYAYEGRKEILTIYAEMFSEVYTCYRFAAMDQSYPDAEDIRSIIYWFEYDNCDIIMPLIVSDRIDPSNDFLRKLVFSDTSSDRFLYLSGEYVTDNEIKTAHFLESLSDDEIQKMADTFTEGYRIGFVKAGKPLDKKKTVNIRYSLGFERVVRAAVANFEKMGLESVIYRASSLALKIGRAHV